jgi:hypothetical protein
MIKMLVPTGISNQPPKYDTNNVTIEAMANELALLQLGDFEPLDIKINVEEFKKEIAAFDTDWVDYLPRADTVNNRQGLTLTNMPGQGHTGVPSLAEACAKEKRRVSELEFNQPTDVYNQCYSLQPFLNEFRPLGRTFLVKCNQGGHFVPHRDHPSMPREVFRLAVFLDNVGPLDYDWLMDDRKLYIEPGRVYYINTRKTHRTISWVDNSVHLIMNLPFTNNNVAKVISHLQHRH